MFRKTIDPYLVFIVMLLVILGVVMISSVSVYPSFKITSLQVSRGLLAEPSNSFYLSRNFFHVGVSLFMLIFFTKFPYMLLEKYAKIILIGVYTIMTVVLIIGKEYNGARGWLDIPGLPSIQPVEFAKIGIIIFLAFFLKKKRSLISRIDEGAIPYFSIVGVLFLLLALQPDFGSILILAPLVMAVYYVGGGSRRFIASLFIIFSLGIGLIYGIGKMAHTIDETGRVQKGALTYISDRIDSFFQSSETLFSKDNSDRQDYQIKQGLIAIGSGGFGGLGFGQSIQKFGYLPEVQGDFIFSVFVEELGFLGAMVLLSIYMAIIYRGYAIARGVKDLFGKYLAFGISTLILVQVFVNVGVNLNVIPLTGVTLPFVSYGGSSLIALTIGVGILLNISRYVEYRTPSSGYEFVKKRRVYSE